MAAHCTLVKISEYIIEGEHRWKLGVGGGKRRGEGGGGSVPENSGRIVRVPTENNLCNSI